MDAGEVTSGQLFGTREFLKNDYLYRMAGAVLGIYGNSRKEAIYPAYAVDAKGEPLDGASRYTVRFAADALPPVNAFWSLTMYELPQSLLVANPIDRYLLNSPMLGQFVKHADRSEQGSQLAARPPKDRSSSRCASTGQRRRRSTAAGSTPPMTKVP